MHVYMVHRSIAVETAKKNNNTGRVRKIIYCLLGGDLITMRKNDEYYVRITYAYRWTDSTPTAQN